MTGVAPRLPSSGWRILYEEAFAAFLADERNLQHAGAVADWIVSCRANGPPAEGIDAGDDFHLSAVPGTRPQVVAEYLVIESEFLIIVKAFM
ncbi:MAG: hypothetical protein ACT4PI_13020 [Actinomycetota bacterium]